MPVINLQKAVAVVGLPPVADFRRWARAALAAGPTPLTPGRTVTIRIVAEAESRELNATYRNIDKPTNVLAFPAAAVICPELEAAEIELGDLAICAAVVAREAAEQNKALAAHYAHLTIHGCLHLLGLDHQTEQQATTMESLEVQLMQALGFANPYFNNDQEMQQA